MSTQPTYNRIRIANPPLEGNARAYLTSDISVGAVTSAVTSVLGFPGTSDSDFYVLYGSYTDQKAEIKLIDASATTGNTFTNAAIVNSHETSDPFTYIPYNQIRIYGITEGTTTKSLLSTVDIDVTEQFTEYIYTGTSFQSFCTAYYNSSLDTISGYSETIQTTSFTRSSAKRIIEAGLRKAMTQIDESQRSPLTWDNCIEVLQDGIDEILAKKRKWPFLATSNSSTTTTAGIEYISKPSNLSLLQFLIVKNRKLDWISPRKYNFDKYSSIVSTNGEPYQFTEKNNKYYLSPTPSGSFDVIYEYYKMPTIIEDLSTEVTYEFIPALIYYCAAEFSYIRGNQKQGDKRYVQFQNLLEQLCIEYSGPTQTGEAESIEETSQIFMDNEIDYLN